MTLGQTAQLLEHEEIVERSPEAAWTRTACCHWALPVGCEVAAATAALHALADRHEVLRTSFGRDGGGWPVQRVHPAGREKVRVRDRREVLAGYGSVREWMDVLQRRPLDLQPAPPVQFEVLTDGRFARDVVMLYHHIVADVRTCQLLRRDLNRLLAAGANGGVPVRRVPRQPVDEATAQQARAGENDLLAPWRQVLAASPPTPMPVLDDSRRGDSYTATFASASLGVAVAKLSHSARLLPAQVLLGLYAFALARYTGLDTSPIAVISSNRFAYPSAVHCCALRVPFALPVTGDHEVGRLLEAVRKSTDGLFRNADHDAGQLRQLLATLQAKTGFNTHFRTEFNYLRVDGSSVPGAGGPGAEGMGEGRFSHRRTCPADPSLSYLEARAADDDSPLVLALESNEAFLPLPSAESLLRAVEALADNLAGHESKGGGSAEPGSWRWHLDHARRAGPRAGELLPYHSGLVDRERVARAVAEELRAHREEPTPSPPVDVTVADRGTAHERLVARVRGPLAPALREDVLTALRRRAGSDAALVVPLELVTV
ncbi:condensation domain-containing protein [Kitasatospora purpeofusca]|uniref:condensation domain-containing protein n=1 Tax=Kitasatospora purpeofusca TaxID=67352 RepID=UPI002A5ABC81|nr:condensation domain-containing protein [Kitasatospora purpeofusca]MDY0814802.1 condensation domain-containing protein [Kitasatospora purpeofusca]